MAKAKTPTRNSFASDRRFRSLSSFRTSIVPSNQISPYPSAVRRAHDELHCQLGWCPTIRVFGHHEPKEKKRLEPVSASLPRDIGIALIWAVEGLMEALRAALLFAIQSLERKRKSLDASSKDSLPMTAASSSVDTPAQLRERANRLASQSLAPSTKKTYERAFRQFMQWLGEAEPGEESLLLYIAYLETEGRAPSTVRVAVSAVRSALQRQGTEIPMGQVRKCLAGVRREACRRPRQVQGIKWGQADKMCALALEGGSTAGLRNATLVGVMSDALLRVSDASAIDYDDVRVLDDGSGRLLVRRSKTDQVGHGCERFLGPPTVRGIKAWCDAAGINEGPLLRPVHRTGSVRPRALEVRSIRRIVQACAKAAGIEGRVSGHSLRVGSAQSLAEANASLVAMQRVGGWSSPSMPAYYTREQEAGRGAVACLGYGVKPPV
ncbi:MAG: tyrosine-type recombinase/integrase, partial [Gammaproteobacteria bacterium]|nr:tyrosine-type recombinase/integrase [Gammaproteobacteria bacterium]